MLLLILGSWVPAPHWTQHLLKKKNHWFDSWIYILADTTLLHIVSPGIAQPGAVASSSETAHSHGGQCGSSAESWARTGLSSSLQGPLHKAFSMSNLSFLIQWWLVQHQVSEEIGSGSCPFIKFWAQKLIHHFHHIPLFKHSHPRCKGRIYISTSKWEQYKNIGVPCF